MPEFRMPVKVTVAKDSLAFIHPTTSWQTLKLKGMKANDFHVDTESFHAHTREADWSEMLTGH